MKEVATKYAQAGYRVLWTYGIVRDEETGQLRCTCPDPGGPACSPGKHPLYGGHGVHDATTDPDVIATWPDDCNIGLACTDTFVVIDIDDPGIAAMLLEPEIGLRDQVTVSTTGRGLHLYLQCAPTKNGILKRGDTGARLGEVRADGYYVMAPPSIHYTGKQYTFIGTTLLEGGPTRIQTDAWDYVREVLSWVNVEIKDKRESVRIKRDGPIPPAELPFETTNATLLSQLSETHPVSDRSAALFRLACDIVREARSLEHDLDRNVLAGVIRSVDELRGRTHPKGPKYARRDNADDYYWDIAVEAERSVGFEAEQTPEQAEEKQAARGSYYYDEAAGFIDNRNPKYPRRIANFEPRIDEQIIHWTGDGMDMRQYWLMSLRRGQEQVVVELAPEDYEDARRLERAIRRVLPTHFIIEEKQGGQLDVGMRWYSGKRPIRQAYAATGWLPDRDAFLIPGMVGAVTADGVDPTVTFEPTDRLPGAMALTRIVQQDADLQETARLLFTSVPARILMPILSQILAAPLCSVGFDNRSLVHVYGPSNTYKTALTTSLMSIYGFASPASLGVDSWATSTEKALLSKLYAYRDLPVLIDDFKAGTISEERVIAMVQGYGDARGRATLTRDRRFQEANPPRGLMISTGEDVWQNQRSALSRTVIVHIEQGAITLASMQTLAEAAKTGKLGALGLSWIRWLTAQGRAKLARYLEEETEARRPKIQELVGESTPRVVSNITGLFVVSRLFSEFVREVIPEFAEELRKIMAEGWSWQFSASRQQINSADAIAPLQQVINALSESLSAGEICLRPKTSKDAWFGMQGSKIAGYVYGDWALLSEWLTFAWFSEQRGRQRRSVGFDWDQVVKAAKAMYPSELQGKPVYLPDQEVRKRMLAVPLSELADEPVTAPAAE